jgi:hypothetical protein
MMNSAFYLSQKPLVRNSSWKRLSSITILPLPAKYPSIIECCTSSEAITGSFTFSDNGLGLVAGAEDDIRAIL